MVDLAVRFEGASDKLFYKILAALVQIKRKGIKKVKFEEKKPKEFNTAGNWHGEIQFLSKEALEIFGKKIRSKR